MICPSRHSPTNLKKQFEQYNYGSLLFAPLISSIPFIQIEQETYPLSNNHFTLHHTPHDPTKLRIIMNIERRDFILCISGILQTIERDKLIFNNGNVVYFHELCSNVYNCDTKRVLTSFDIKNVPDINILI